MLRTLIYTLFLYAVFFSSASTASDDNQAAECSFAWTGRDWFAPQLHGDETPFRCITCGYQEHQDTCCPACAVNCHKGHEIVKGAVTNYYCDCGAGEVATQKRCCQITPKSIDSQFSESGFNYKLSAEDSFSLFKRMVKADKSSTFSVIGLYELMRASGAMQGKNSFSPLNARSLQLNAFQFGHAHQVLGIKTAETISALNELIERETSFKNLIAQNVLRALAITAISNEKFLLPFDEEYTNSDFPCFTSNGQQTRCTMMKYTGEANGTTFISAQIEGARLKYEGSGSLLLFMANPKSKKQSLISRRPNSPKRFQCFPRAIIINWYIFPKAYGIRHQLR